MFHISTVHYQRDKTIMKIKRGNLFIKFNTKYIENKSLLSCSDVRQLTKSMNHSLCFRLIIKSTTEFTGKPHNFAYEYNRHLLAIMSHRIDSIAVSPSIQISNSFQSTVFNSKWQRWMKAKTNRLLDNANKKKKPQRQWKSKST